MAISYVGVNNAAGEAAGSVGASTVSITPTLPGSTANGDRVFVYAVGTTTSGTTPTNWQVLGTKDTTLGSGAVASGSGARRGTWYYRDKTAAWSAMPSWTLTSTTNNSHWIGAVAIRPSAGSAFNTPTITTVGGSFNTATTSYTDSSAASFTTTSNGFLMIGTGLNDNVTSTTSALTQTGATFGTVTERADGGTGTGNIVAGKVHTVSVTTGAANTTTFTLTLSAASQGETLIVQQTESALPAKAETIVDNFATQDTGKWTFSGAAAVSGGQLTMPVNTGYPDFITSVANYDLTDSAVFVQVPTVSNQGNGTTETILELGIDSNNRINALYSNNNLQAREIVGGVSDNQNITWDATNHKWWRIRESGGVIFWDTSPDGDTWTNQRSLNRTMAVTNLYIRLQTGYYGTEPSPGTAAFDNVNTVPSAPRLARRPDYGALLQF